MVDRRKKRHRELSERLPLEREPVLDQSIPASVHIETMADYRSPVTVERPKTAAAAAYRALYDELQTRMA